MANSHEGQLERLRQSMATLESQRSEIGNDAIEPALNALRAQIAVLEASYLAEAGDTEERRIVTILFTDIVGSTSIAEKMDPEDWRTKISVVHEMAGKIVDRNDGRVLQYLGDGLLAIFGTETSSERDPERGINAALEIISNLPALDIEPPLQMRAGVHTGLVVMGELGSYAKREFTASGDAMNLASRLESSAPADGVLISHDTYRYVRGLFDMTLQAPFKVRGRQDPLQTYLVHQAKTHPYRMVTRGVGGVKARTIGRKAEINTLFSVCQEAVQTKGTAWNQIRGVPGVGKTRLLQDLAESLELLPTEFQWLKTQAIEGDAKRPYSLVRRMWFERFQIAEDSPIDEAEERWIKGIQDLLGTDAEEEAHILGLLAGLPFEKSRFTRALRHDPVQMRGRAFVISRLLLKQVRRKEPIVLLIEDLQWADQASWEYITHVIMSEQTDEDRGQALLVLATTRPEWKPPAELLSHPAFRLLDLPALSDADCRTLIEELLQRAEKLPDHVLKMIVERSQGVPYFAEEIINWLIDKGVLDLHVEPWEFKPSLLDEIPLPGTLQHLLTTRLSSLTEIQRKALEHASIFGRNFWEGGLSSLGTNPSSELLVGLERRGFIETQPVSSFAGKREWRFHHNLMRDVAYENILKKKRPSLHKEAAAWLESQAQLADRLEEFAGVLGDHCERAGELSEAADWYLRAGERAWSQGAVLESKEFYDHTVDLLPPNDRERLWRVLLNRDEVFGLLGEVEKRRADEELLLKLAIEFDDPGRLAEAYYRRGVFLQSSGDNRLALIAFEEALERARQAGNFDLEMTMLAWCVHCQSRLGELPAAAQRAEKALAGLDEIENESTRARIMTNSATFFTESGDISKAAQLYKGQIEINQRLGDKVGEAIGLANIGYIYLTLGLFENARSVLENSMKLHQAMGARRPSAYNFLNLGLVLCRIGEYKDAKHWIERAQYELDALGDTFAIGVSYTYLGLCLERAMKTEEACSSFQTARDILSENGLLIFMQDAIAGLVRCKIEMGSSKEALGHANGLWEHLQKQGSKGLEFPILAYLTCVNACEATGDNEKSKIALEDGWKELKKRADKISDQSWRKAFLENVPEHRALLEIWDRKA